MQSRVTETVATAMGIMYNDIEKNNESLVAFVLHIKHDEAWEDSEYRTHWIRKNTTDDDMYTYMEVMKQDIRKQIRK